MRVPQMLPENPVLVRAMRARNGGESDETVEGRLLPLELERIQEAVDSVTRPIHDDASEARRLAEKEYGDRLREISREEAEKVGLAMGDIQEIIDAVTGGWNAMVRAEEKVVEYVRHHPAKNALETNQDPKYAKLAKEADEAEGRFRACGQRVLAWYAAHPDVILARAFFDAQREVARGGPE